MIKKIIHIYFVWLLCFFSIFSSVEESSISRYTKNVKRYTRNAWNIISANKSTVYALATCGALVGSHVAYFIFTPDTNTNTNDTASLENPIENKSFTTDLDITEKTPQKKEESSSTPNLCEPKPEQKPRGCDKITVKDVTNAAYNYIINGLEKIISNNDPENPADPFSDSEKIDTHLSEEQLTYIGKKANQTGVNIVHTSKNYAAQLWNWIKTTDFRKEASDFIQSSGPNKHGRWKKETEHQR